MTEAIEKEKQMKKWKRDWKIELIQKQNPNMVDLAENWFSEEQIQAAIEEYKRRKHES